MMLSRTVFLTLAGCFTAVSTGVALEDPGRDPVDLDELKKEALVRFCKYMKQRNPHIRDWKKGELPTEKELKALIKRRPSLEKELNRIRSEFYRGIEEDEKKKKKYRKKKRGN
jgi:hypothetical protein